MKNIILVLEVIGVKQCFRNVSESPEYLWWRLPAAIFAGAMVLGTLTGPFLEMFH